MKLPKSLLIALLTIMIGGTMELICFMVITMIQMWIGR